MLKRAIILVLALILVLVGCTQKGGGPQNKITVYTTYYPLYDFTKIIGGDKVSVLSLVPTGVEPHDWEPSTKDIINLSKAKAFIYVGANMEPWKDKVVSSIDTSEVMAVEASKGVNLLKKDGQVDGHVWLNPQNSKILAGNIRDVLIKLDAANSAFYQNNYNSLAQKLDQLDAKFTSDLSEVRARDIVVSHDAYSYLANKYNLNETSIMGLDPEQEPNAAKIQEIVKTIKDKNIKYIFAESLINPKLEKVISDETGAMVEILNPIENLTAEQISQGRDYFSEMERNLEVLKKALGY